MGRDLSITVEQFEAALENGVEYEWTTWKDEKVTDTFDESSFWHEGYDNSPLELPGVGTAVYVDGEHGGEGSAEYIWQVWQIGDQYFRKTGYYVSYDGSNWDGSLEEVVPFEKTVTDWKTK
jgi:hypothetical protein